MSEPRAVTSEQDTVVDVGNAWVDAIPVHTLTLKIAVPDRCPRGVLQNADGFNPIAFELLAERLRIALAKHCDPNNWEYLVRRSDE